MTILAPASQLGILAIAAALLMIGGEFDLSIGSMIAFTGLVFAAALVNGHWPLSRRHPRDAGVRVRSRRDQRTDRHPDEASVLHRHAGVSVHPARPDLVGLKFATGGSTQLRGVDDVVQDGW